MSSDGHTQGAPAASGQSDQERRVAGVLGRRDAFADLSAFLSALLDLLRQEPDLQDGAVARVALALDGEDTTPAARFWADLSARFPGHALAAACHGNALLRDGRDREAMGCFSTALGLDPQVVVELEDGARELARALGGALWLRFQLAELRVLLADFEDGAAGVLAAEADEGDDADEDEVAAEELGEEVRERYSELLDEHHDDPDALAQIREVGAIIAHLEHEGLLPQCLIRRGTSRR